MLLNSASGRQFDSSPDRQFAHIILTLRAVGRHALRMPCSAPGNPERSQTSPSYIDQPNVALPAKAKRVEARSSLTVSRTFEGEYAPDTVATMG